MQPAQNAPARQKGFVAVFAAVAMVAMLSAVALSIDIGRLYTAQRDLQRAASLAALDAVQVVSGCTGRGVTGALANAQAEVAASLLRNGFAPDSTSTAIGMRDDSSATTGFTTLSDGDPRLNAVQVTLRRASPARLIPGVTGSGTAALEARAAAGQAPRAGVSISPSALSLNSSNSPLLNMVLGGLLGGSVNLTVAAQQGLATAQVKLGELALAAGVATPAGLASVNTSLPGALQLLATALNATGGAANSSAAATLNSLAAVADPARNVLLGDVLEIGDTVTGAAAETFYVDALSLLMALSESAVEGQTLSLPLTVALPAGLANLSLALRVSQAPKIVGPGPAGNGPDGLPLTYARAAAIQLLLRTDVLDISGALSALSPLVGVVAQPIRIGLDIDVGAAEASVRSIQCPALNRPDPVVDLDVDTQLAALQLGTFAGSAASLPSLAGGALISAINLPIIGPVLSLSLSAPASLQVGAPSSETASYINNFPPYVVLPVASNPQQLGEESLLGSAGASLSSQFASRLTVRVLGVPLPLGSTVSLVGTLLTPLFTLLDSVIEPLLAQLGVQAGGASVAVFAVDVPPAEVFSVE